MNDQTKQLFKAYLALTDVQKNALEASIKDYKSKPLLEQRIFSEVFNKSLGPTSGIKCAVCGK